MPSFVRNILLLILDQELLYKGCVKTAQNPHLFVLMKDDLHRTTVDRFLNQTLQWRGNFDQVVAEYWQEIRNAIEKGNTERVKELNESYTQKIVAAGSEYCSRIDPKEAKGKKKILDAIILFRLVYFQLEIYRTGAYKKPLFGQVLTDLDEGKSDLDLGHLCTELSKALRENMAAERPPLYDGTLELLLQEYESWHKRIKRICKRYRDIYRDDDVKRFDAIAAEFPVVDTEGFVGEFTPQYIVLNILATGKPPGQSNVSDLKRALARARKIRKALKPLGIEFAPPMPWLSEFQEGVGKVFAKLRNEPS